MYRRWSRARPRHRHFGLNSPLAFGALFAAAIAALAWRAHALSPSGALAAFVVGTLTYGSGGWAFTLILLAFFVPSVALSRLGRARKKTLVDIGKGGARDAAQVLANGGVATVCAVIAAAHVTSDTPRPGLTFAGGLLWVAAFAGAYAAATADTWGTEIGTLARGAPRSILGLQPIAAGLSGGITIWGTVAEVCGAAWLAAAAVLCLPLLRVSPVSSVAAGAGLLFVPVALGGIAGALTDSLLGATLQELRHCPACARTCETDPHVCGTPTVLVRGRAGFSNDAVNGAATLVGAAIAYAAMLVATLLAR